MSMYLAHAITALRKVKNREPLDECDVAIIEDVLTRLIQENRTPFQRLRDHYIIGTERFKILDGLDYYRTILLKRKSAVWYPESDMSEVSIYEVYTGAQLEPPDSYSYNLEEHGSPEEQAEELKDRCQIGPCFSATVQDVFDPEAFASLRSYVAELCQRDTVAAVARRQELEHFLRSQVAGAEFIADGNLDGMLRAFLRKYRYTGKPRALNDPKQKVADLVRHATNYAREVLRNNPMTVDIANHLEVHVKIGKICEYHGDWKWRF